MELLQESVIAFFAAVGLAAAVWTAAEGILLSRRDKLEHFVALVPVAGDAPALERTVAGLQWTTICGNRFDKILIADCGLTDTGRQTARLLARRSANVTLCTMSDAEREAVETGPSCIKTTPM